MSVIETRVHSDPGERRITFERVQDVEPIIEHNKAIAGLDQHSDWGRAIAEIPNIFLEQWLAEEYRRGNVGIRLFSEEFNKIVRKKLNDPEWRFLRIDK